LRHDSLGERSVVCSGACYKIKQKNEVCNRLHGKNRFSVDTLTPHREVVVQCLAEARFAMFALRLEIKVHRCVMRNSKRAKTRPAKATK